MKKLTKLSVKIHDKTQLETVINYSFSSGGKERILEKKQKYEVDVYFFFPPQLNINKSSYSKEDFYEDLRPLIRLKEPNYSYDDFITDKDSIKQSPFDFLFEKLVLLSENNEVINNQELINELRILSCSIADYISKTSRDLAKDLKSLSKKEKKKEKKTEELTSDERIYQTGILILKKLFLIFRAWQRIFSKIESLDQDKFQDLKKEVSLLDENLLSIFYRGISRIFYCYEKYSFFSEGLNSKKFYRRLKSWFAIIRHHYKVKPYFMLTYESSRYEKESYAMRLAYLKKRMWQVLYLDVKDKASFFKRRQLAYIIAAGFAAIWALVANLLIWHKLNFHGYSSFFDYSDEWFGFSSYLLILAFISAYILKDRIKDFARDKFQGGIFNRLPDSTEQIWYYDKITKKKSSIGMIYESQQYIDDLQSLPLEIRQYRFNRLKGRFIEQEDIIRYYKKILLDTRKIKKLGKDLTAIKDIIRHSVKRYITRLDDPEETNFLMSKEGIMKMAMLPKVYYIDMVIKYSQEASNDVPEEVIFECRRLILNKEGLVRIVGS